jgi:hypothetical protein
MGSAPPTWPPSLPTTSAGGTPGPSYLPRIHIYRDTYLFLPVVTPEAPRPLGGVSSVVERSQQASSGFWNTGHEAIRRGAFDQLLEIAACPLCSDRGPSVLNDGPGVDQFGNVLARHSDAPSMEAVDRFRTCLIPGQCATPQHLG